jgi:uncharacterized protein YprB with RNaseH-like and TPR domain
MPPLGPRAAGIFSQTFCADVWPPSGIAVRHEAISSDPKMLPSVAFCDVETTGLSKDDRIVNLGGIARQFMYESVATRGELASGDRTAR